MFRVKLVSASKLIALGLFLAVLTALSVYFIKRPKKAEPLEIPKKLDGPVVAIFNNTRYAHEVEGVTRFVITAGVDKTYADGTHELEQVRLESHGTDGTRNDVLTADRAKVSDPADLNKLDAEFLDNVVIQIADTLIVKTSYLHYDHPQARVDTPAPIEFDGEVMKGRAIGAIIESADERAQLLKDVDVTIKSESERKKFVKPSHRTTLAQVPTETAEEKAARKARKRARKAARKARKEAQGLLAKEASGKRPKGAKKTGDKGQAASLTADRPTRIRCTNALLEKPAGRLTLTGNVRVDQEEDEMRAARMVGFFNAASHIERIEARGDAYLKQADKAEIQAPDMDFFFEGAEQLSRATATGGVQTRSLGAATLREARAKTMEAFFEAGLLAAINANGDAAITVHAPAPKTEKDNPAHRELTAQAIAMQFYPDGKFLQAAEATGNARLVVTPSRAMKGADKKTITAPQMNARFFEADNRLQTFVATNGVKVELQPTLTDAGATRTTTSQQLSASFFADTQDVERLEQQGDFKYNEADRNALAERAIYDGRNEVLWLRGKRPVAWDAKARTQADEIDYDRKNDETHARGDVRTTYYSRETTNDSTPFKNTKSPIFLTAERADARNREGIALYTGNARGWQDDNFVKGDRIELYEKDKRMVAVGQVESALYNAKQQTSDNTRERVPGFAEAESMSYSDSERLVRYEGKAKARQGTDRIEGDVIEVLLQKESNEVERLTATGSVALAQPGRRGTGDKLVYTDHDGRAVLTGKTARIDDVEKGTVMGGELTFYSRDDTISVQNQEGTGRVRSAHRVTKNREK